MFSFRPGLVPVLGSSHVGLDQLLTCHPVSLWGLLMSPQSLMESVSHSVLLTVCKPMDLWPTRPLTHGILQARTLEWIAIPFSRGSSWFRNQIQISYIAGRFFTVSATRAKGKSLIFNKGSHLPVLPWVLRWSSELSIIGLGNYLLLSWKSSVSPSVK